MRSNSRDSESNREKFALFEYANYCGLVLALAATAAIQLVSLWIEKRGLQNATDTSQEGIMWIILIVSVFLYFTIRQKAYSLIGVTESITKVYIYTPNTSDLFKIVSFFEKEYLVSRVNKDVSLEYKFNEKENEKAWNGNKKEAYFLIEHKDKSKYHIKIQFKTRSIILIRPTIRTAKTYEKEFEAFLLTEFKNNKLFKDIKLVDYFETEAD